MADLTAIILTYNEQANIRECIESVRSVASRIVVVDSFSTDETVQIATALGVDIYQNPFANQAQQFRYALGATAIATQWVLRLDADERLTSLSAQEIDGICINNGDTDINGIVVRFEVTFMGRRLRHGGIYPFRKLIVFKFGLADVEQRHMDEHIFLIEGRSVELANDSVHRDYKDLTKWVDKHNEYATRELLDLVGNSSADADLDQFARAKRRAKTSIYYRLPMWTRAHLYFIYRYYLRLGFLDGREGRIFAFLQAYWYRFLVDSKIYEHRISIAASTDRGHVEH